MIAALNERLVAEFGAADAPEAVTVDEFTANLIDDFTGGTNALAMLFLIFVLIALLAAQPDRPASRRPPSSPIGCRSR